MKIVKPFALASLNRPYAEGMRSTFLVGCSHAFRLDDPATAVPEQAMWKAVAAELPPPAVFDAGFPKPAGEMLVAGHAAAPHGAPSRGVVVTAAVGSLRRRLAVFGNRVWQNRRGVAVFSEPEPFATLPLGPGLAFGGPGHAGNPGGIGAAAAAQLAAGLAPPLPNIEDADAPIRTINDAPEPAVAGPLDITLPSRRKLAGTYDAAWLAHRHPGLPADADPALFHAAQPKQRLASGFFAGDEAWEVSGMHPVHRRLTGTLPGLRLRAFARMRGDAPDTVREVALRCETVWLFGTALLGVVLWRGALPVAEPDAADLQVLMLAAERLHDPPRDAAHYAGQMRLRTDKETAGLYALQPAGLMPDIPEEERRRRQGARATLRATMAEQGQRRMAFALKQALDAADPAGRDSVPPSSLPPSSLPDDMPVATEEDIATGDVDFAGMLAFARKQADAARALVPGGDPAKAGQGVAGGLLAVTRGEGPGPASALAPDLMELFAKAWPNVQAASAPAAAGPSTLPHDPATLLQEVLAQYAEQPGAVPHDVTQADGGVSGEGWETWEEAKGRADSRRSLLPPAVLDRARAMLSEAAPPDAPPSTTPPATLSALLDGAVGMPGTGDAVQDVRARLEASPVGALLDRILATGGPVGGADPANDADPQARLAEAEREMATAMDKLDEARRVSPAVVLPKRMPDGVAIRLGAYAAAEHAAGRSLAGRDFAGAARFAGAFAGADAPGSFWESAALGASDWTGARLARAVFTAADLGRARLPHADLAGANLSRAHLGGADLSGADLSGATLSGTVFAAAALDDTRWTRPVLIGTDLAGVSLRRARIREAVLMDADLTGADLTGAVLERCVFLRCKMAGVRAAGATFVRCALVETDAAGIDLEGAVLERFAASGEATTLRGARLIRARAAGITFAGTDLTEADLTGADLAGATMVGAVLHRATLAGAVLRRAMLAKAVLTEADGRRADLFEASLRGADLSRADLRSANLFGADTAGTRLGGADLTGANLDRTLFELPGHAA